MRKKDTHIYFSEDLIESSFHTLQEKEKSGKKGLERTSALLYFLAFSAIAGKDSSATQTTLNFNPNSPKGKLHRAKMTAEYVRIAHVHRPENSPNPWFVDNLGSINMDGTNAPERRISSNFYSVPLTKASKMVDPVPYPGRPCPLLSLGERIDGERWGIAKHNEWRSNLPAYLADRKSSCPWTVLAIFVARRTPLADKKKECPQDTVSNALEERFDDSLLQFWRKMISFEKIYSNKLFSDFDYNIYSQNPPTPFK